MPEPNEEVKKIISPTAESQNWELRVKTEVESHHKWNEDWGTLFPNEVPNNLSQRREFLEQKLKEASVEVPRSPIGYYPPLKDVGAKDHRRKRMFGNGGLSLAELEED